MVNIFNMHHIIPLSSTIMTQTILNWSNVYHAILFKHQTIYFFNLKIERGVKEWNLALPHPAQLTNKPCYSQCRDFSSFEAGIADANSSFKWRKIYFSITIYISQIELVDEFEHLFPTILSLYVLIWSETFLTLNALNELVKNIAIKGFYSIWNHHNLLVRSIRFTWIPMLWVYDHFKYFYSYTAGITLVVRIWRL